MLFLLFFFFSTSFFSFFFFFFFSKGKAKGKSRRLGNKARCSFALGDDGSSSGEGHEGE